MRVAARSDDRRGRPAPARSGSEVGVTVGVGVGVGVIVPVHGWAPYLAETLDAILGEQPDEVVVVDDGSPTPVELHGAHAAACRLVRHEPRRGLAGARAAGLAELGTTFVALCDGDDVWEPGSLGLRVAGLGETAAACFGAALIVGPDGRPTGEEWSVPDRLELPDLFEGNPLCVSSVVLRRDALLAAGGLDSDLARAEDWELWLRLLGPGRAAGLRAAGGRPLPAAGRCPERGHREPGAGAARAPRPARGSRVPGDRRAGSARPTCGRWRPAWFASGATTRRPTPCGALGQVRSGRRSPWSGPCAGGGTPTAGGRPRRRRTRARRSHPPGSTWPGRSPAGVLAPRVAPCPRHGRAGRRLAILVRPHRGA